MNPTPELDGLFAGIFKPGAVILTTGFRGGGKTHTAIAVSEQLIKGYYPSIPKVEVFTNVIFLFFRGFCTDKGIEAVNRMLDKGES